MDRIKLDSSKRNICYIVDGENIQYQSPFYLNKFKNAGLVIYLNSNKFAIDKYKDEVKSFLSSCNIIMCQIETCRKQQIDSIINSYVGYLVGKYPDLGIVILSKDRGFSSVVDYWRALDIMITQHISQGSMKTYVSDIVDVLNLNKDFAEESINKSLRYANKSKLPIVKTASSRTLQIKLRDYFDTSTADSIFKLITVSRNSTDDNASRVAKPINLGELKKFCTKYKSADLISILAELNNVSCMQVEDLLKEVSIVKSNPIVSEKESTTVVDKVELDSKIRELLRSGKDYTPSKASKILGVSNDNKFRCKWYGLRKSLSTPLKDDTQKEVVPEVIFKESVADSKTDVTVSSEENIMPEVQSNTSSTVTGNEIVIPNSVYLFTINQLADLQSQRDKLDEEMSKLSNFLNSGVREGQI